jgi:hypothetical protein
MAGVDSVVFLKIVLAYLGNRCFALSEHYGLKYFELLLPQTIEESNQPVKKNIPGSRNRGSELDADA